MMETWLATICTQWTEDDNQCIDTYNLLLWLGHKEEAWKWGSLENWTQTTSRQRPPTFFTSITSLGWPGQTRALGSATWSNSGERPSKTCTGSAGGRIFLPGSLERYRALIPSLIIQSAISRCCLPRTKSSIWAKSLPSTAHGWSGLSAPRCLVLGQYGRPVACSMAGVAACCLSTSMLGSLAVQQVRYTLFTRTTAIRDHNAHSALRAPCPPPWLKMTSSSLNLAPSPGKLTSNSKGNA